MRVPFLACISVGWENRQKMGYVQGVLDMCQTTRLLHQNVVRGAGGDQPSLSDRLQTELVECLLGRHMPYHDVLEVVDRYAELSHGIGPPTWRVLS
jgi:hypothetical protein